MSLIIDILVLSFLAVLSCFLRRRIAQHKLKIGRISFHGIHDVHYSGTRHGSYHFDFSCSVISPRLCFPTKPSPRWFTLTVHDVRYRADTSDISTGTLLITFWFFPILFRQTAGPWVNAEVDELRIRIMHSDSTPSYIKRLRETVVGAILNGDILRVDDFGTGVRFAGLTEEAAEQPEPRDGGVDGTMPDEGSYNEKLFNGNGATHDSIAGSDGCLKAVECREKRHQLKASLSCEEDELRMSAFTRGLHINDHEGRYYSFESIDAQLRRNWTANRGSFVLIAIESRWIRVPWPYQLVTPSFWPLQLLSSIAHFPYDLVHVFNYPMTTINIYVPRVDITFDNFRIRDAELVVQAFSLIREKMAKADIRWQDILADCLADTVLGMLESSKH